jgi:2-polyprenyl-6-hydroxyphenyl methylase/3-demethylubiquinone-9 3-methyltransferase
MNNLKSVDTHFAFGENWSEYANLIDDTKIQEAEKGLLRLVTKEELAGKSFLDIGCGSGLHALAALRLGAARVLATDIDPNSVATTKAVLEQHAPTGARYEVQEVSVFDLPEATKEQFDIVYSWGVLHHTGAMYEAITAATKLVAPSGMFAVALYGKTPMCGVWTRIKRWYSQTSETNQKRTQNLYIKLLKFKYKITRKDFEVMRNNYFNSRGMSFEHDVHDWLGGYPYESITPARAKEHMQKLEFTEVRKFVHDSGIGFFGTGCDEFVFKKVETNS